jgi:hypothetical protein
MIEAKEKDGVRNLLTSIKVRPHTIQDSMNSLLVVYGAQVN